MSTSNALLFVLVLLVALLAIWLIRSRGNTAGRHVDTSMTALGAATEAVEDLVEDVGHAVEKALASDVKASGAKADDPVAVASNASTLMASGAVLAGDSGLVEIGVPAAVGAPDDLRRLKGVGPKLNGLLTSLGITRFDQIAAWGPAEIARVDANLGTFKGRIARDNWVEQAALLASGDIAGFEARFGKLDS